MRRARLVVLDDSSRRADSWRLTSPQLIQLGVLHHVGRVRFRKSLLELLQLHILRGRLLLQVADRVIQSTNFAAASRAKESRMRVMSSLRAESSPR